MPRYDRPTSGSPAFDVLGPPTSVIHLLPRSFARLSGSPSGYSRPPPRHTGFRYGTLISRRTFARPRPALPSFLFTAVLLLRFSRIASSGEYSPSHVTPRRHTSDRLTSDRPFSTLCTPPHQFTSTRKLVHCASQCDAAPLRHLTCSPAITLLIGRRGLARFRPALLSSLGNTPPPFIYRPP